MSEHVFDGQLFPWREDEPDSWVFVALPSELSDRVEDEATGPPRGFGSVRVQAAVGGSEWSTSVFPSKDLGTYVLPVRKSVRHAEDLAAGDVATFTLRVLD
jgi:hypothetical protein